MHSFDESVPEVTFVEDTKESENWAKRYLETARENGGLGLDSETSGLDKVNDKVLYWSVSDGISRLCLPASHIRIWKDIILENPNINFDMSNAKFDMHMFANSGALIVKAGEIRDTTVMSWLLNENNLGRHGLKETVQDWRGRVTPTFIQVFGKIPPKRKDKITGRVISKTVGDLINEKFMDPAGRFHAADYASLDSYNSTDIRKCFDGKLGEVKIGIANLTLRDYFYSVEVPFTKVLWNCERRGFTIDLGHLKAIKDPIQKEMVQIAAEFATKASEFHQAPTLVNLDSPKQVVHFFIEILKKRPLAWTEGGASGVKSPSVNESVLEKWAKAGDVWAEKMLRYRGLSKLMGTYVEGLIDRAGPDLKIHTTLNQHGTVTGRLSSTDPNLQNIPRDSEDQYKIRDAFTHDDDEILIVADYEQLEMRLMAHFSNDEKMIKAIIDGIDLHCFTVAEMYGIHYDEVMAAKKAEKLYKEGKRGPLTEREEELIRLRQAAKVTGFGIIYGIQGPHLAENLTKDLKRFVSEQEGYLLIKKWLGVFPGVSAFIESTKRDLHKLGYVQTITGRFRRFGDLKLLRRFEVMQAERQGVNSIIQGTAADIAKRAMIISDSDPVLHSLNTQLLLQVHDELIFKTTFREKNVTDSIERIKSIMENPFDSPLSVPLPVSIHSGHTWASAK